MSKVNNILFDLGGVIINLDFKGIENALKNLLGNDYLPFIHELQTRDIFNKFETGELSEDDFFHFFTKTGKMTRQQAEEAWHSILLDIPPYRLELLKTLAKHYNLYLLSNTNSTHIQRIENMLSKEFGIQDFRKEFFVKGYYSYEIKMRKPERRIYEYVLNDAGLKADETLFIDDNESNIENASKVGIQTILHKANSHLNEALGHLFK